MQAILNGGIVPPPTKTFELAFETGYLVDFIGVERSRSNTDANREMGSNLFFIYQVVRGWK
jgi:hypothetical protein